MASVAQRHIKLERLLAIIVVLQLLNDTPQLPSDNFVDDVMVPSESPSVRVLSLKREKELAEILSFLAATTDDPKKVAALCVEERPKGTGMVIRMAVNNGGLQHVESGFKKMAIILERIAKQGSMPSHNNEEASLLRETVSFNHNRILCRLGSRHATLHCQFKKEKQLMPKVIPQLYTALTEISGVGIPSIRPSVLADLKSDVYTMRKLYGSLEAMVKDQALSQMGLDLLIEMVMAARKLHARNLLEPVLEPSALQPHAKARIIRTIMKLGRYDLASSALTRAAKELSIFTNIQISVIKLSPLPQISNIEPGGLGNDLICDLFGTTETGTIATSIPSGFGRKDLDAHSIEKCISRISSTKFVVHAEIQLLIFYELQNAASPPRVLCSTKKACFLCNLFISLHGTFIIPSTHGRIYEKWTFPERMIEIPANRAQHLWAVVDRFYDNLKGQLRGEIFHARKPYPAPYESTLFRSGVWTPVARSGSCLKLPLSVASVDNAQHVFNYASTKISHLGVRPQDSAIQLHPSDPLLPAAKEFGADADNISSCSSFTTISSAYLALTRGQLQLYELSPNRECLKIGTPLIHLTISYERWRESQVLLKHLDVVEISTRCWVKVKWLQDGEFPEEGRGLSVVDLGKFPQGSQKVLDKLAGNGQFYLSRGSNIVFIKIVDKPD